MLRLKYGISRKKIDIMSSCESLKSLKELTEEAARSYVRFAVYVDDHVYSKEAREDRFWAQPQELVELFAGAGIALTLFEFHDIGQKQSIIDIVERADISILDWEMYCTVQREGNTTGGGDSATVTEENFGKLMLKELSAKEDNRFVGPRLICIYTKDPSLACAALDCEPYLDKIAPSVYIGRRKRTLRFCVVDKDPHAIQHIFDTTKSIGAEIDDARKSAAEEVEDTASSPVSSDTEDIQVGQQRGLNINEKNFVPVLLQQFASIHSGILPTLGLQVVGSIRDVTPQMMESFSSEMDNAFIIELALAAYPEYAPRQLVDALFDYFAASFKYGYNGVAMAKELACAWIGDQQFKQSDSEIRTYLESKRDNAKDKNQFWTKIDLDKISRREWIAQGMVGFLTHTFNIVEKSISRITSDARESIGFIEKLFRPDCVSGYKVLDKICQRYACLCHIKAKSCKTINPNAVVLSLGSVVKCRGGYYLCVQQGCDSLRVERNGRSFLFIPLLPARDECCDLVLEEQCYCVDTHSYNICTWKFSPLAGQTEIRGVLEDNKIVFKGKNDNGEEEVFEWLFDLKDRIALKIADDISRQMARVAIDISEWLRLKGKNMKPLEQEPPIPCPGAKESE